MGKFVLLLLGGTYSILYREISQSTRGSSLSLSLPQKAAVFEERGITLNVIRGFLCAAGVGRSTDVNRIPFHARHSLSITPLSSIYFRRCFLNPMNRSVYVALRLKEKCEFCVGTVVVEKGSRVDKDDRSGALLFLRSNAGTIY